MRERERERERERAQFGSTCTSHIDVKSPKRRKE